MKLFKKIMSLGSKLLGSKKSDSSVSKKGDGRSKKMRDGGFSNSRAGGKSSAANNERRGRSRGASGGAPSRGGRGGRSDGRSEGGREGRSDFSPRSGSRDSMRGRSARGGGKGRGTSSRTDLNDPSLVSIEVRKPKEAGALPVLQSVEELSQKVPEFAELGLDSTVLSAVADMGYVSPTPIQKQAIPAVLKGRDVIGTAQTGTGKTAAFALPIVQKIESDASNFGKPVVLILSPTRELATQTDEAFKNFARYADIKTALIQGGVSMRPQIEDIRRGAEVLVATPGRLLDLIGQRVISLNQIKWLVLDEVDRMFDMGFIEDVSNIIRYCPKERQTLFFSATMPDAVLRLSEWALTDPEKLENGIACSPADTIEHFVYPVDGIQKYDMIIELLKRISFRRLIVFTRTRMDADRIGEWLIGHDYKVSILHSDRTQRERDKALADFKDGKNSILVATDIASRGLDISDVDFVVNYNVPEHSEDYVHRIGRTGRANHEGTAVTLFSSEETEFLHRIEALINAPIERRKLEGFAYRNEPIILHEEPKRRRRNM